MVAITVHEFIYLLPILILGGAIVTLLFLLLLFRVSSKVSAIFTVTCLSLALISSVFLGCQIISHTNYESVQDETVLENDNRDKVAEKAIHSATEIETLSVEPLSHVSSKKFETGMIGIGGEVIDDQQVNDEFPWNAIYVTALFTSDGYGALYASLILLLSIIVSTLSFKWFYNEHTSHSLFYLIVLFSALGAVTLIYSSHLISLFIGIELLSIPVVGLVGYQYTQRFSLEAAIKYMILSLISTTFLLLGIAFYYAATGELTFSGLSFQLSTLAFPSLLLLLGVCLMLVGIGFKLSLVPFQLWLPDVYQGAPACISLLLTTVGKVAVFCAVARLFLLAPIVNNETIRIIMIVMAFGSIIWGSFFLVTQHNIKRLLAYSSIIHFGYLLVALIAVQYQVLALETIGVYLIGYVLANICVLGVISLESRSNATHDQDNDIDLRGLFWRRPIIASAMGIGLLSLAGVPLTVGFIARFALILLAVTAELWWLVVIIVVGSAFGLYFYLRLIINLYLKPSCSKNESMSTEDYSQYTMYKRCGVNEVFIVGSALLIVFFGVYPKFLLDLVSFAQYLMPQ